MVWSNFNTCVGATNRFAEAHTGTEALVDLNGDGLPEIVEGGEQFSLSTQTWSFYRGTWFNNGYSWKPGTGPTNGEFQALPRPLWLIKQGSVDLPACLEGSPAEVHDGRQRMLDINGSSAGLPVRLLKTGC